MGKLAQIFAAILLLAGSAFGQAGQTIVTGAPNPKTFAGAPTGACGPQDTAVDTTTGNFYVCKSAAWLLSGGGGGGGAIGTGNPWVDVLTKGADPTGTNDNTTAFNAAVTAVASGGTIHVPCPLGTACLYIFKTANWAVTATANTRIIIDAGVVLQAQTGFPLNFPLLYVAPAAGVSIYVEGGVFDCNSLARGIQATGAGDVYVNHIVARNSSQFGVEDYGTGLFQLTNSFLFNDPAGFEYYAPGGTGNNTKGIHIDRNHFDTITGNPNAIAAGSSGANYFEASENLFTNITIGNQQVLYCFGCDYVDWQRNRFDNVVGAIHCDTCGGGNISYNLATNSTGAADFFQEVGSDFTMEGNISINDAAENGLIIGVGSNTQSPASLGQQIFSFDSTTGFTAGTNVALTTDNADKQEGTGSMVATANGSFTTGTLWYNNFGTTQNNWNPYQEIWIKPTSGATGKGQLNLICSNNTALSTQDLVVPLPGVAQNTWLRAKPYGVGWQGAIGLNGFAGQGFKSCGITVTTSSPSLVVKFDDYRVMDEAIGNVIQSNKIISPFNGCMRWGAVQNTVVRDNECYTPVGTQNGYINNSSTNTLFQNNRSFFSPGATGTVHLISDATASASSVIDSGSITNAATYFQSTAGGIRLSPTSLGGVPSCAFTSGGGTSPSCALQTGSTDNVGTIILTTGTGSPGSGGTLTLTFSSAFGTNPPTCLMIGSGTGAGQWSARVSFIDNNASTTSDVQSWDNSGTVLSASTAYRLNYRCYPK